MAAKLKDPAYFLLKMIHIKKFSVFYRKIPMINIKSGSHCFLTLGFFHYLNIGILKFVIAFTLLCQSLSSCYQDFSIFHQSNLASAGGYEIIFYNTDAS